MVAQQQSYNIESQLGTRIPINVNNQIQHFVVIRIDQHRQVDQIGTCAGIIENIDRGVSITVDLRHEDTGEIVNCSIEQLEKLRVSEEKILEERFTRW